MKKTIAMMAATLVALAAPVWAQDKPVDSAKTVEIRAYLLNKERATVNIVGITALLVVEGKDGADVLIPLQVITTKTGEKYALQSSRTPREIEGTRYSVSLVLVQPEGSRSSKEGKPEVADKNRFTLEGPFFKADLTREQLGTFTCKASVRFTIDGTVHSAKGFHCSLSKCGVTHGPACCPRIAAECHKVESHLKAGEMDKAVVAVDRLSASLNDPCGEVACEHQRHGCASCCKDLRAALSTGNREKAQEALETLKAHCSTCSPDGAKK